jgi:CubicO group peptidase (beta-lactamase class C family)
MGRYYIHPSLIFDYAMTIRALVAATLLLALPASAQQHLRPGDHAEGSLTAASKDIYTFDAETDFYLYGYVDQLTVDVVVTIVDPTGQHVNEFDSPARGPEPFQFSPEVSGRYRVEVTSFEGAEGDYEIVLVAAEPKATNPKRLVDQMMTPFSGNDVPGAAISILLDGKVAFAKGYGMANLAYNIPMTAETGMSIASVSKQFTGMAVMLMVNEGKMDLDEDIRTYLPELQGPEGTITLRHMLNHTSGLREILNFLPMAGITFADAMRNTEPQEVFNRQPILQNEPGAEYNYNNTTFMLLARAVEEVSGQDWKTYMEERIFSPLGMDNTTVKTEVGQVILNASQGYAPSEHGGYRAVIDFAEAYGASSVNTTARDITKWMLNYRDMTVGGPEAIEAMTTRGILTSGDTTGYALGLGVTEWRGQRLWTHTGGETAHRTWFGYFPDIQSGMFISSANPAYSNGMWTDIAEAWFGEYLEPEEDESPKAEKPGTEVTKPTAEQLEAIAGLYQFIGAPLQIEYTVEDGTLYAQATGQPRFEVRPTSDSTFTFVGVPGASVTFHYDQDGSVTRGTHHQGPDSPMEKIDMPEEGRDLAEYEGRYWSAELETLYTLKVDASGALRAYHRRIDSFPITHVAEEQFSGGQWFLGQIEFVRAPDGSVAGFKGGNGRTRGVWFESVDW